MHAWVSMSKRFTEAHDTLYLHVLHCRLVFLSRVVLALGYVIHLPENVQFSGQKVYDSLLRCSTRNHTYRPAGVQGIIRGGFLLPGPFAKGSLWDRKLKCTPPQRKTRQAAESNLLCPDSDVVAGDAVWG